MYQVYGTFSSYGKGGWVKVQDPVATKKEAEKLIKNRHNVVLYDTMKYKIEKI